MTDEAFIADCSLTDLSDPCNYDPVPGVSRRYDPRSSSPKSDPVDYTGVRNDSGSASPARAANRTSPGLLPNFRLEARLKLEAPANHKSSEMAEIDWVVVGSVSTACASSNL